MSWEKQKLVLAALCCLTFGILMFCAGVALGLSQDSKKFLDTLVPILSMAGTWVASLGTIAAVIVALWLAEAERRSDVEHINGRFGYVAVPGRMDPILAVSATADGKRPVSLTSISLYSAAAANVYLTPMHLYPEGSSFPKQLVYGENAIFLFERSARDGVLDYISNHCKGSARELQVFVSSTLKQYEVELPRALKDLLEKEALAKSKSVANGH